MVDEDGQLTSVVAFRVLSDANVTIDNPKVFFSRSARTQLAVDVEHTLEWQLATTVPPWQRLDAVVLHTISKFLSVYDLAAMQLVCRTWKDTLNKSAFVCNVMEAMKTVQKQKDENLLRMQRERRLRDRALCRDQCKSWFRDALSVMLVVGVLIPFIIAPLAIGIGGLAYFVPLLGSNSAAVPDCASLILRLIIALCTLWLCDFILLATFFTLVLFREQIYYREASKCRPLETNHVFTINNSIGVFVNAGLVALSASILALEQSCAYSYSITQFAAVSMAFGGTYFIAGLIFAVAARSAFGDLLVELRSRNNGV